MRNSLMFDSAASYVSQSVVVTQYPCKMTPILFRAALFSSWEVRCSSHRSTLKMYLFCFIN